MLIRLLCTHEMTKRVCKISRLNSKRLLRKPQKMLGGYFIFPHPVHYSVFIVLTGEFWNVLKSALFSRPRPKAQDQDQGLLFCPWGVLRPRPWSRTTTLRCLETKTLIKDYHLEVSWDQDLDQGLPPWGVLRPRPWSRTTTLRCLETKTLIKDYHTRSFKYEPVLTNSRKNDTMRTALVSLWLVLQSS